MERKDSSSELSPSQTKPPEYNRPVLKIRKELTAIIRWDKAQFSCDTPTEVASIPVRAVRKSELLQPARKIAQMN